MLSSQIPNSGILNNANIKCPKDGDVMVYDNTSLSWVNASVPGPTEQYVTNIIAGDGVIVTTTNDPIPPSKKRRLDIGTPVSVTINSVNQGVSTDFITLDGNGTEGSPLSVGNIFGRVLSNGGTISLDQSTYGPTGKLLIEVTNPLVADKPAGSYTNMNATVDEFGIITAAANGPASLPNITQVVHVNKMGNDTSGNGSLESPFLTITKALSTITDASLAKAYIISVGPGTYDEATIAMRPAVFIVGANAGSNGSGWLTILLGTVEFDTSGPWASTNFPVCGLADIQLQNCTIVTGAIGTSGGQTFLLNRCCISGESYFGSNGTLPLNVNLSQVEMVGVLTVLGGNTSWFDVTLGDVPSIFSSTGNPTNLVAQGGGIFRGGSTNALSFIKSDPGDPPIHADLWDFVNICQLYIEGSDTVVHSTPVGIPPTLSIDDGATLQVINGPILASSSLTGTGTTLSPLTLVNVGTAGTYTNPSSITTDAFGRVSAVGAPATSSILVTQMSRILDAVTDSSDPTDYLGQLIPIAGSQIPYLIQTNELTSTGNWWFSFPSAGVVTATISGHFPSSSGGYNRSVCIYLQTGKVPTLNFVQLAQGNAHQQSSYSGDEAEVSCSIVYQVLADDQIFFTYYSDRGGSALPNCMFKIGLSFQPI